MVGGIETEVHGIRPTQIDLYVNIDWCRACRQIDRLLIQVDAARVQGNSEDLAGGYAGQCREGNPDRLGNEAALGWTTRCRKGISNLTKVDQDGIEIEEVHSATEVDISRPTRFPEVNQNAIQVQEIDRIVGAGVPIEHVDVGLPYGRGSDKRSGPEGEDERQPRTPR